MQTCIDYRQTETPWGLLTHQPMHRTIDFIYLWLFSSFTFWHGFFSGFYTVWLLLIILLIPFLRSFTQTQRHIVTCSIHQSLLWLIMQFLLCSPLISLLPLILQYLLFIYFSLVTVCIHDYILCCLEVVEDSGKRWSWGDSSSNFSFTRLSSHLLHKEKSILSQTVNYVFLCFTDCCC